MTARGVPKGFARRSSSLSGGGRVVVAPRPAWASGLPWWIGSRSCTAGAPGRRNAPGGGASFRVYLPGEGGGPSRLPRSGRSSRARHAREAADRSLLGSLLDPAGPTPRAERVASGPRTITIRTDWHTGHLDIAR